MQIVSGHNESPGNKEVFVKDSDVVMKDSLVGEDPLIVRFARKKL